MTDDPRETEQLIFEAACEVFQQKGYNGARMQEIADRADISKAMLHYYYRTKDELFEKVYMRQLGRFFPRLVEVLQSRQPFDRLVSRLVETYYEFLTDNPNIASFIVHEINQNPDRLKAFVESKSIEIPSAFVEQVKEEIDAGRLDDVSPNQLLVSILGMIVFPFLARPMVETLFSFEEADMSAFIEDRKAFIVEFVLNGVNYDPA